MAKNSPPKSNPQPAPRSNNPPPKTQEDRKIQQVNELAKDGKITKNEAKDLKDQIRDSANKDGQLSNKESKKINKEIERDKKDKGSGKDDKPARGDGGRGDGGRGDGGRGDGGRGDGGRGDGGRGDGGRGDGGRGDGGGGGGGGKGLTEKQVRAIVKEMVDNSLDKFEKSIKKQFKELNNQIEDLLEMGGDGPTTSQEPAVVEEPAVNVEPVVRGGGKKIDVPKAESKTKVVVPDDSERIDMPNLDKMFKDKIEKLTLEITNIAKEFIEGGIDYTGIDYIAQNEILGEDGRQYYTLPDYNAAVETESGMAEERAEYIKELINELLLKGDSSNEKYYNYKEFIDLFELRYNGSGDPYYRFSIEIAGDVIDDLTVYLAEDYSDIE